MSGVLIVDDVPSQSLAVALLCRSMGIEAHCAESTAEAYCLFKSMKPEAVIVDLVMPGADGFDCLFMISKLSPSIPVAVTTASEKLLLKAAAELTDGYGLKPIVLLPKPIGLDALQGFLQHANLIPGGVPSDDDCDE